MFFLKVHHFLFESAHGFELGAVDLGSLAHMGALGDFEFLGVGEVEVILIYLSWSYIARMQRLLFAINASAPNIPLSHLASLTLAHCLSATLSHVE